ICGASWGFGCYFTFQFLYFFGKLTQLTPQRSPIPRSKPNMVPFEQFQWIAAKVCQPRAFFTYESSATSYIVLVYFPGDTGFFKALRECLPAAFPPREVVPHPGFACGRGCLPYSAGPKEQTVRPCTGH